MLADSGALVVRTHFDPLTYVRGVSYSSRGSVLHYRHDPVDDVVHGDVQGRAREPYRVAVSIERSESGAAVDFEGECTCPVGHDCKHVVALLLDSSADWDRAPGGVAAQAGLRGGRGAPVWEKPLGELIRELEGGNGAQEPQVALQFELAEKRPGGWKQAAKPGIELRPVVRGASGNWIRTGITWSRLDHSFQYRALHADQRRILSELLAIQRLSALYYGRYSFGSYSSEPTVWLEDIASRRLWDLLANAAELGLPLVQSGRGRSVKLVREPAEVGADLVADGEGLWMAPYVRVGPALVPLGSCLLIGDPPHGLAWWGDGEPELGMVPLSRPLGKAELAFLHSSALRVPGRDRARFMRDFFPRLARSVEVTSSDGSVDLPELPRVVLVARVRHQDRESVVRWQQGLDGSTWREDLWAGPQASVGKELEGVLAAAAEIVRAMPSMVEQTWAGERLAARGELSGMDAVRFVTELLPALAAVPGLLVEEEGEAPCYREAEGAPVVSLRPAARDSGGDWFDLSVEVAVDGEEVVFQELFVALAEGQSHLLLPSGTYFPLDRPELAELAELIAEARAMQDRDTSAPDRIRLSRFQAGLWEDLQRVGVLTAQAEAWDAAVRALSQSADSVAAAGPPSGLEATLRGYQQDGFAWLDFLYRHRLGGILADDMGLGKTLQALALVCHAREKLEVDAPFLVVAPTSVVENWASECRRFAPEVRVATIAETKARRWVSLADLAGKADLVVTSYTLFRLEYDDYEALTWAGVFVDEAQFVKNPRSIIHQRVKELPSPFKLAMTGTPIENNLRELWALLSITSAGLFPRWDRFAERYATPIERSGDSERLAQLRRRIRPLMLRRTKEQVESELPDKQEQVLELELAPRHRRRYQVHLQRERQKVLGLIGDIDRHRIEILRSLTVLRQAALDIALVDDHSQGVPSTKLDELMAMLSEIVADRHRVLVFSQFTRFLSMAAARATAAGIEHCYLDGKTRKREKVIAAFREGHAPVFFISLKAGGFGLNLTEADYCILLDPWWNPATEAQAVDRAHRIGQTRKVMVYRLVAKDTIEEKVMGLKARKAALFASVMDAGGFETATLSAADIRELLG